MDDRPPSPRRPGDALPPPLLDVSWVLRHLDDPGVVVVEVGADAGAYHEGHVPGAVALGWLDDLHDPDRRGAPSREHLAALLSGRGIGLGDHVVLYGSEDNLLAAYAYWVLRYYRHRRVSLLDGGKPAWVAAGAPLTRDAVWRLPTGYACPAPDESLRVTRDAVLERYLDAPGGTALVDVRQAEAYHGRHGSAVDLPLMRHRLGGHIPGARNLPVLDLLDPATGRVLGRDQLAGRFARAGVEPGTDTALYCDVGGRSALAWLVLHDLLGHRRARVYDGGWAEYGSLVGAPVRR